MEIYLQNKIGRCVLFVLLLMPVMLFGQQDYTTIKFKGIRPDDRMGLVPLRNPGRGLRIDVALDLKTKADPYHQTKGVEAILSSALEKYCADSISVIQACIYLSGFEGVELSDSALVTLQSFFDEVRLKGMKTLIRFAYETGNGSSKGASFADIRSE